MRRIAFCLLITCLLISFTACGYKEGIIQSSPNSYLKFTGNTRNAFATLDGSDPFPIQGSSDNGKIIHYEISPGKHRIIIQRNNTVILDRDMLIGKGMTKEINVK
jgi:hypothetical protein